MANRYIFFALIVVFNLSVLMCLAQANVNKDVNANRFEALEVGDKVPDYTLINLINYPTKSAKLSEFRGKLLILDFWNTACASCIEGFPKLLALQEQFKNDVQIILLNPYENEAIVSRLFSRRKELTKVNVTLPTVCRDTALLQLFSVRTVPHIVWISKDGIVKAITRSDAVNSDNIATVLNNEPLLVEQKTDVSLEVDMRKPLFINGNGGNGEKIVWQSTLSKYIDGMPLTCQLTANEKKGYSIYNATSVEALYRYAYSDRTDLSGVNLTPITLSRTFFNIHDKSKYADRINGVRQTQNLYVYQLISGKPVSSQELQVMMQEDLRRYFGFNVSWQKKELKCLVLTAQDTSLIGYKSGNFECSISDVEIKLNAVNIPTFIKWMEDGSRYYFSPYPIIDETGFNGLLGDIDINTNVYDYVSLNKALQKYKMNLKLENRTVRVLMITEYEGNLQRVN